MFKQIAAAVALAGCLPANGSAQAVALLPDSLSVTAILETIAREAADGHTPLGSATAYSISKSRLPSWRADSLLVGLRDIAVSGSNPDVRALAASCLAASGTHLRQPALLLEVFDSAQDARTRAIILSAVSTLPDARLRRDVILRALKLSGDRGSHFLVATAAFSAINMGDEGVALLQSALNENIVSDEWSRKSIEAAIANRMRHRGRR